MDDAAKRLTEEQQPGSGTHSRVPEPSYLTVGRVTGVHGVRGEIKVQIMTDDPHRFRLLDRLFLGRDDRSPTPWVLEGYRLHKGRALLKLEGCDDRTAAHNLLDYLVQVPQAEAIPLEEGQYFEYQILGLGVWTTSGEHLGSVVDILYTGANDVYVIQSAGERSRQLLIPAIKDVILQVDLEAERLVVELPDGLL